MADTSSSSSAVPLDVNWSKTEFKVVKLSHVWTIEKFSLCPAKMGECFKSPAFSANLNDRLQPKWCLDLYPKGRNMELKNFVSVILHLDQYTCNGRTPINASFKLAVLNANRQPTNELWATHKFMPGNGRELQIQRDTLLEKENELLVDDRFSIFCEISIVDVINVTNQSTPNQCSVPQLRLSEDFGALLESGMMADCVLCSDGKEFEAHKNVLACRSPVFAAMFDHDTEEKRTNKVNIEDISAPVLGQLLHFVYTGEAPNLLAEQDMAEGLLVAADKYQLGRLKALCEQQLSYGLNKDNVCALLICSDRYFALDLQKRAIEYINLHADQVMESDGWRTLVSAHPQLLKRVVRFKALTVIQHTASVASQQPPNKRQRTNQSN